MNVIGHEKSQQCHCAGGGICAEVYRRGGGHDVKHSRVVIHVKHAGPSYRPLHDV